MVYIVFVNPQILGNTGMDKGAVFVATCIAANITEAAPAVVAAITMPLTYSIATGIGLGFITYALAKLIAGKFADAKPAVLVLALIFALKFAIG
jgi:xanthine/uracil/vitamin C permease (AzgA family)